MPEDLYREWLQGIMQGMSPIWTEIELDREIDAAGLRERASQLSRKFDSDYDVGEDRYRLASILRGAGVLSFSYDLYVGSLVIFEKSPRIYSNYAAMARFNIADILYDASNYVDAATQFAAALEAAERHPQLDSLNLATIRLGLGRTLAKIGRLDEAELLYRSVITSMPLDYVDGPMIKFELASLLMDNGLPNEAELIYRNIIDTCASVDMSCQQYTVGAQLNLATMLHGKGLLHEAETLYYSGLDSLIRLCPEGHHHVATTQALLATLHYQSGRFDKSEPLYRAAAEALENYFPQDHPYLVSTRYNLANVLMENGALEDAEALYQKIVTAQAQTESAADQRLTELQLQLAILLHKRGALNEAEPFYRAALESMTNALSLEHPEAAKIRGILASQHYARGQVDEAELLYRTAIEGLPPDQPDLAAAQSNLAKILEERGLLDEAEEYYRKAISSTMHPIISDYRDTFNPWLDLTLLLRVAGKLGDEELICRSGLSFFEDVAHLYSTQVINLRLRLIDILRLRGGGLDEAEALCRIILDDNVSATANVLMQAKYYLALIIKDKGHWDEAYDLMNSVVASIDNGDHVAVDAFEYISVKADLADLAALRGRREESDRIFDEICHDISHFTRSEAGDAASPALHASDGIDQIQMVFNITNDMREIHGLSKLGGARLHMLSGKIYYNNKLYDNADDSYRLSISEFDAVLINAFLGSTAISRGYIVNLSRDALMGYLCLVLTTGRESPASVSFAFTAHLRRKGLEAEAEALMRAQVLGGRYPDLRPKLDRLDTIGRNIGGLEHVLAGLDTSAPAQQRDDLQITLAELRAEASGVEAELTRAIPEMNLSTRLHTVTSEALRQKMPAGSALVDFGIWFTDAGERHYLVFVITAANDGITLLDLGSAETIDALVARFRADASPGRDSAPQRAPGRVEPPDEPANGWNLAAGIELKAMAWDPLAEAIGTASTVFLSPVGDLAWLPFEILPATTNPDDRTLLGDEITFAFLAAGRDLLRLGEKARDGGPPLIVADPAFDYLAVVNDQEPEPPRKRAANDADRGLREAGVIFKRLEETRGEAEAIAELLGVEPLLDRAALRGAVLGASPRILHIATHGFFLPYQEKPPELSGLDRLAAVPDPMLRSGLALAGANDGLRGAQLPEEAGNGLLTAADIRGMDLLGTDLVVASACETALGQHTGDGILGLQRAFITAGARSLVISLWQVPDNSTRLLMTEFYRNLATMTRAEALRQAKRTLRDVPETSHPMHWAGFILVGEQGKMG